MRMGGGYGIRACNANDSSYSSTISAQAMFVPFSIVS